MKVLIVCSGNVKNFDFKLHQTFIYEQIEAIKKEFGINYDTFFIKGKGIFGYLKNIPSLKRKLKEFKPDIIHAHYNLSGMVSLFQRKVPVVVTYHGSDVNIKTLRILTRIVSLFSDYNIFVSKGLQNKINSKGKSSLIPCGIETEKFFPMEIHTARNKLFWDIQKIFTLFASNYDNKVKNFKLAKNAIKILGFDIEIIELKNRTREEVNLLLNSCNLLLLTSKSEGSPQIIKEAMACNCPIVATDVGDIKEIIGDTEGCYITSFDPEDVAEKIRLALDFSLKKGKTNGREKILKFDNKLIAKKVYQVYKKVLDDENSNN